MKKQDITKNKPLVTVVVPAYNEEAILEANLLELCNYMNTLQDTYEWELIVVNDGSTDSTGDLADAFIKGRKNARVLHHMYNFRLGQALRYAFSKSKGDFVIVMDLDLSYSLDHIAKLLDKIHETRAKIVIASPYTKGGKVSNVPWLRKKLSVWANRFLCMVANKEWYSDRLTNITGMMRAYDGIFLRNLNLKAMDVDINPEIIYKAKILRARIVEIPAHLDWGLSKNKQDTGKSRKSSMRILRSILQSLLSGFILRPFLFFIFPGIFLFVLSFYPLTWSVIHTATLYKNLAQTDLSFDYRLSEAIGAAFRQAPHAFIVGGIALMVAIQFISLGFLAYQKKRYFEELYYLGNYIGKKVCQCENSTEIENQDN